ncbi:MAG: protein of unknown function transrane [Gemmatimonadetes bacterium]|nr:protein of unknown function transrane [Gemmatimonadota bacterium]
MPSQTPTRAALDQTLDVETPELVVMSYTLAGVGSRAYAAIIDYMICLVAFIGLFVLMGALRVSGYLTAGSSTSFAIAILVLGQFFVIWGYYVLFEGLADGQTPGKKNMGLRVVRDGGYSVGFGASAVRNLVRIVDMQPVISYGAGLTALVFSKSGKRLGDMVAGTIVVKESLIRQPVRSSMGPRDTPVAKATDQPPTETLLTDDEFGVLARFIERRSALSAERRTALATQVARRFAAALEGVEGGSDSARLVRLHDREAGARQRGAISLGSRGAAREKHAIVAGGSPRWTRFAATLAAAQQSGLKSLGEEGVRNFVAEYRDVAGDLARLRTAARGAVSDEVFYLSRMVSGAHNLLYRGRSLTLRAVIRGMFLDAPREVRRSVRPIMIAAVMMFLPAIIAYVAVVRRPSVAPMFIPRGMLDRANDGVRRAREGEGYISDPGLFRPVMATSIISNNVQVTFAAFALGITAGVGTTTILVSNGVSLGGVSGLYASKGIGSLLLAFVAPHGVLELTAICIAGGGGLLLAAALLIPGARTRRRALIENGARAIRLVGASTMLLLVAGTIEGFISPIEWWPLEGKLAVSGVTAVFMMLYLRAGRRAPRQEVDAEPDVAAPVDLLALTASRAT